MIRLNGFLRVLVALEITLVLFLVFTLLFTAEIIRNLTKLQEQSNALDTLVRAERAIDAEAEKMRLIAWDYATWDETFAYVQQTDRAFIDEHLDDEALTEFDIDGVVITDCHGEMIFARTLEPDSRALIVMADLMYGKNSDLIRMSKCPTDFVDGEPYEGRRGILNTSRGAVVFGAQPVVTSLYKGPPRGMLTMFQFITPEWVKQMSWKTNLNLRVLEPVAEIARVPEIAERGPNELDITKLLYSATSEPSIRLRVSLDRSFYQHSEWVLRTLIATLAILGALMIIVCYVCLRCFFVRPLGKMKELIADELPVEEKGESTLAQVRKMIEALVGDRKITATKK